MPTTPPPVAKFLAAHKRARTLHFHGELEDDEMDVHEITIDPAGADDVLSGEETGFTADRHVPIGFITDRPLFVDVGRKALPVLTLSDGEAITVAASFEKFVAACAKEAKPVEVKAPVPDAKAGPKTVPGPRPADWPSAPVLVPKFGRAGEHFLWFNAQQLRADKDLYYKRVRKGLAVASKWKSVGLKYDRGTGVWLDVAELDLVPIVTARVRALVEALQPKGLEFLPIRGDVKGKTADVFVMTPTRLEPCLDVKASGLPPPGPPGDWMPQAPKRLVFIEDKLPKEPCFFRAAEYPVVILASGAMVEALRNEGLSGFQFNLPR